LRAEFLNKGLSILPGEYVRVRLSGGELAAITVPQTAVMQGAKGPFVWIVNAAGSAEQRVVKTGAWQGEQWRVLEGLQAGEVVILDNLLKLKPGQAIKPGAANAANASSGAAKTS
jgi:membrane fusion protein, multidrug efflux system